MADGFSIKLDVYFAINNIKYRLDRKTCTACIFMIVILNGHKYFYDCPPLIRRKDHENRISEAWIRYTAAWFVNRLLF